MSKTLTATVKTALPSALPIHVETSGGPAPGHSRVPILHRRPDQGGTVAVQPADGARIGKDSPAFAPDRVDALNAAATEAML